MRNSIISKNDKDNDIRNITIKAALETFAAQGDLAADAKERLK